MLHHELPDGYSPKKGGQRIACERTDNAASLALHARAGFTAGQPWINRRGRQVVTMTKEWED